MSALDDVARTECAKLALEVMRAKNLQAKRDEAAARLATAKAVYEALDDEHNRALSSLDAEAQRVFVQLAALADAGNHHGLLAAIAVVYRQLLGMPEDEVQEMQAGIQAILAAPVGAPVLVRLVDDMWTGGVLQSPPKLMFKADWELLLDIGDTVLPIYADEGYKDIFVGYDRIMHCVRLLREEDESP